MSLPLKVRKAFHNACLRKPGYASEGEALRVMYRMMISKGILDTGLVPYECDFGKHFHYGHKPGTRKGPK
jgi:hypothetical protein